MNNNSQPRLIRVLGLGALIIYGVGDILGAGIYAIIGHIAGHAGSLTWLAFAIAMGIAFLTALTYGELSSRFPQSGGVSVYVQKAFGRQWLSILAGLLLLGTTFLSMSTLSHAFVGYLRSLGIDIPNWLGVPAFLIVLLLINIRGIKQSSFANIISTMIETSGLLIVLICGFWYLFLNDNHVPVTVVEQMPGVSGVFQGAALAFFAFIGFEDLANIAEEVKKPERNIPRAIIFSLSLAGLLYLGVSWMATAIISGSELSQSDAPLLAVVSKSYPALPQSTFAFIALFAIFNTTLLNYITASRLLYGMSKSRLLPVFLQKVHQKFHTPYAAILLVFPIVVGLGLASNLKNLASSTSALILIVFSLSSIALVNIKLKPPQKSGPNDFFCIPVFIPCLAIVLNLFFITFLPLGDIIPAGVFIVLGGIITWLIMKSLNSHK